MNFAGVSREVCAVVHKLSQARLELRLSSRDKGKQRHWYTGGKRPVKHVVSSLVQYNRGEQAMQNCGRKRGPDKNGVRETDEDKIERSTRAVHADDKGIQKYSALLKCRLGSLCTEGSVRHHQFAFYFQFIVFLQRTPTPDFAESPYTVARVLPI